jgi:hypothetical protein
MKSFFGLAAIALFSLPALAQNQAANQTRIRGVIDSYNAPTLVMKTQDGQTVSLTVPATLRIMANAKTTLADIKPGDFVSSAADKGPDGRLHAEELHVFPESMRALAKVIAPWARTPVAPPLPEPLRTIPKREP